MRCWVQLLNPDSGLSEPHHNLLHTQFLATAITSALLPGAAAAATAPGNLAGGYASQECFALCVTSLKVGVYRTAQVVEILPFAGMMSAAEAAAGVKVSRLRLVQSLLQAAMTANVAMAACGSISSSSSSSSSSVHSLLQPAWQLLLTHSLHALGSALLAVHTTNLLPAGVQGFQQPGKPSMDPQLVLQCVVAVVGWSRDMLSALQQQAEGVQPSSAAKKSQIGSLLQQQESLLGSFGRLLTSRASSSSSSSSNASWQSLVSAVQSAAAQYARASATPSAQDFLAMGLLVSLRSAVPAALAQQLVDFAAALSGRFPAKLACNAPGCSSLAKSSELEAVGGKSCMCAKCRTAR
jgi:hypothetical protein